MATFQDEILAYAFGITPPSAESSPACVTISEKHAGDVTISREQAEAVINCAVLDLADLIAQKPDPELAGLVAPVKQYLSNSVLNLRSIRDRKAAIKALGESAKMAARFLAVPVVIREEKELQENEDLRKKLREDGVSEDEIAAKIRDMPSVHDGMLCTLQITLGDFANSIEMLRKVAPLK